MAVTNLWVGGITSTSVEVAAKLSSGTNATLVVSTNSDLSSPSSGSPVAISGGYVKVTKTGLSPSTQYYYGIDTDGTLDTVTTGSFRTAPTPGAASFDFVFGSCAVGSTSNAFTRAAALDPDLCFITGDLHYEDPASSADFHTGFDTHLGGTAGELMANVPTSYTWSDHDWSSDSNGGASSAMNATANSIYRLRCASHTLEESTTGIYHTFVYGRVRFIVCDERSFKSANSATDNSSKTILGSTQKQWLKDTITAATEPVIFWIGDVPWTGAASTPDDEWFAYNTERQELGTFFAASGKNIIRMCGDQHALAADDGTNSAGGIPVLMAAPWDNLFSNKGTPYTDGPYPTSGASNIRQYGHVTITDTGSQITVDFAGYDTSDVERVSLQLVYDTAPTLGPWSATANATTSTATFEGAVTGTLSWSGSAAGVIHPAGSATGTLSWSGSTTGVIHPAGASTGSLSWVGSATGLKHPVGAVTGSLPWVATATGLKHPEGSASGTVTWVGTAMSGNGKFGTTSGTVSWTGSATGLIHPAGSASGTLSYVGTAAGVAPTKGSVTASFSFTGSAAGVKVPLGSATGSVTWVGSATGDRPTESGAAIGTLVWAAVATGENFQKYFEPPTHEEPMRTRTHPLNYYRLTYAKSVVRVGGSFAQIRCPAPEVLEAAGVEGVDYFLGGRVYEISSATAAELTSAGYTVT